MCNNKQNHGNENSKYQRVLNIKVFIFCFLMFLFQYSRLGVKSGGASVYHKTNRETMVEIGDSIRGKDIYIIQTGTK